MPLLTLSWRPACAWVFILALFVLHHDFWQWDQTEPLLWGWAPVGLWYHVVYTLFCVLALFLLGRWAWPDLPDIETAQDEGADLGKVSPVSSAEQAPSERGQRS